MYGRKPFNDMESGESLDRFHQRCVVPTSGETSRRNADVDQFVRFLHREFNDPPYTVAQVVKAGSLGKGTAVRRKTDIDLVVFLNGLSSIKDLENARPRLLRELEANIRSYRPWRGRVEVIQSDKYGPDFSVALTLDGEDMDVLPACNAVRMQGPSELYRSMANYPGGGDKAAWPFSASLAPLQIDFVKPVSEQVKTVIRLVKLWKKEKRLRLRSYTVELITIYAARSMSRPMTTQSLFEDVLRQLKDCHSLKVAFNDNYNSQHYARSVPRIWTAPYVMDPANPFLNTLDGVNAGQVISAAEDALGCL